MALKDDCRLESRGRYKREWCWVSCVEMQISLCKAGPGLLQSYCFSSSLLCFPTFFSSPLFPLTSFPASCLQYLWFIGKTCIWCSSIHPGSQIPKILGISWALRALIIHYEYNIWFLALSSWKCFREDDFWVPPKGGDWVPRETTMWSEG